MVIRNITKLEVQGPPWGPLGPEGGPKGPLYLLPKGQPKKSIHICIVYIDKKICIKNISTFTNDCVISS